MSSPHDPLTIVIFGAKGDLSRKKLLPALMDLYEIDECLGDNARIVGFSREECSTESFREYAAEVITEKGHEHAKEAIDGFLDKVRYCPGDFTTKEAYRNLATFLNKVDEELEGGCSNKLYYLAVPPVLYETIFENLASSGLGTPCGDSWVRIAVEKPFGKDLETAKALDKKLGSLFAEDQIFRIDHYLEKETLENILAFRFSNVLFEPLWCRDYIEQVHIRFLENFGVGTRGAFYDAVGALRDVGQNHMLQMLALIGMEDPADIHANSIRAAREKVLSELKILTPLEIEEHAIKGQYATYRNENNIASDSKTETYFKINACIDNDRWREVPFILEGGKLIGGHRVDITITFKTLDSCMQVPSDEHGPHQNQLVFSMYPNETISIKFWAKKRGFGMDIEPRQFMFNYNDISGGHVHDAYEKLLLDCIHGDQTSFTTSKEVEYAWRFITPIVEGWREREPVRYDDCSNGPVFDQ